MRLASYNLQNLFDRAKALNSELWTEVPDADTTDDEVSARFESGRELLNAYSALNARLREAVYDDADKAFIRDTLVSLGLAESDDAEFVRLRQNKGRLVRRHEDGTMTVVANGRGDWTGWLELEREEVDEVATRNTARVLKDVDADVVAVVEAEDRIPLLRFNENVLPTVEGRPYDHVMVVNGNDERGIDVGLMSRSPYGIELMCSHVDDREENGRRLFSRDCAKYRITVGGEPLWLLVNHFKSKGYGGFQASQQKRRRQARRVAEIYRDLVEQGYDRIAVLGDLNDTPDSQALAPLFVDTDLRDVSEHANYQLADGRIGTFGNGTASAHIDFILLSPALFERVTAASVFRCGVWGGRNGTLFPHYPEITRASEAASDHAAVWVDLDL